MKIGNLRNTVARGGFWTAWLLLVATGLTPAPAISFCLAFLTVTCAVFPLALGTRRQRIGAVIVLLLGVVLAGIQSRRLGVPSPTKSGGDFNNKTGQHSIIVAVNSTLLYSRSNSPQSPFTKGEA